MEVFTWLTFRYVLSNLIITYIVTFQETSIKKSNEPETRKIEFMKIIRSVDRKS